MRYLLGNDAVLILTRNKTSEQATQTKELRIGNILK